MADLAERLGPLGSPPPSEAELLRRARALAGAELRDLADLLGHRLPPDPVRAKGWVGQLVEDALGAGAGSRPVPDFERLGIELKTVPIDGRGRPRESTYVTTLPLADLEAVGFEFTHLAHKLARVLFVPVEAAPELPMPVRRFGSPLLWRPGPTELAAIEADWRLFRARFVAHGPDGVGSELGDILQVRPKGADARDTVQVAGPDGRVMRTMRRGLYLRPAFVFGLFERAFHLPPSR